MKYDQDTAIAILSMLKDVSLISGNIDDKEVEFIRSMGHRLELDDVTIDDVLEGRLFKEIPMLPKESDRIPMFYLCALGHTVNGEFDENERTYCERLGFRMGIRPLVMGRLLDLMEKYFPRPIPTDELQAVIRVSHN
jgi:hypothetical protein